MQDFYCESCLLFLGESDRHIHEKKPKHLFSGKRKQGKTDRR